MSNTAAFESDYEDARTPYDVDGDSDDDSLIDVDSPADGYFANREHPQETFVENPSLQQSEDKAREAAEERSRGSAAANLQPQISTPPRAPAETDESAPLLDAGPAPPDYATATAGRRVPQLQQQQSQVQGDARAAGYGSIASPPPPQIQQRAAAAFGSDHPLVRNGLLSEQGILGSRGSPQSMRDAPVQQSARTPACSSPQEAVHRDEGQHRDEEAGAAGMWKGRKGGRKRRLWRRCFCRPMSWLNWFLIFIVILAVVLISRANIGTDGKSNDPTNGGDKQKLPVHKHPKVPIPDPPQSRECSFDSSSQTVSFDFNSPGNFSILELISETDYSHLLPAGATLSGTMKIVPGPANQEVDIRVWVSVATTRHWTVSTLKYIKDSDGLELKFPEVDRQSQFDLQLEDDEKACLDIAVLVQVREGVTVQDWKISTANMGVIVESGLFLSESEDKNSTTIEQEAEEDGLVVRNETSIWALKGDVDIAYWSSRHIRVSTISGRIKGTYALLDSLELESVSGAIEAGVEPKKEDEDHPAPAELSVISKSGQVDVEFPSRHGSVLERDYRTRVESHSSKITGRYVMGSSGTFTSYSGELDIYVLPYSASLFEANLYTSTYSSKTSVTLLDAITSTPFVEGAGSKDPQPPHMRRWNMGSIHSTHKSISGRLDLTYSSDWTGMVDGRSVSGKLDVKGKDVKIIKDVSGPGERRIAARKGVGDSKLVFKTVSGGVNVLIGDEE